MGFLIDRSSHLARSSHQGLIVLLLLPDPATGYVDHTEKLVARGTYLSARYPSLSACEDSLRASDTVSFTVHLTAVPQPRVRYAGTDYRHGATIALSPGSVTFEAVEVQGMSNTLQYQWTLDGSAAGTNPTLTNSLTAGTHKLRLKITNAPSNAASCEAPYRSRSA